MQRAFGIRIDRIFASVGGLFVVLDQVDAAADEVAEGLSADIPVVLIDPLAFKGLQRLGASSPLAGAKSCYNAKDNAEADGLSRLRRLADEKLKAARVLLDQNMTESALDLVVTAMMSAASDMAGKTAPRACPGSGYLAVWRSGACRSHRQPGGRPDHEKHWIGPRKNGAASSGRRTGSGMRSGS